MPKIQTIADIVDWRLCVGCGACAYICPEKNIQLWDFPAEGIRPVLLSENCTGCSACLDVCPAVLTDFTVAMAPPGKADLEGPAADAFWGPVLDIWEGHAIDPEIRFNGSSGGVLTALSLYCVEQGNMHGVLHIAQNPQDAVRNQTRLSRTRKELLAATGSRYSPASVCNHLEWVEQAAQPCVVIGKPAEIAALRKAQHLRPELHAKVGLALSFFCAETPSTGGTVALLGKLGVVPESVVDLRYRGFGWPGHFAPRRKGETEPCTKLTYRESWAFLQAYRPWSVQLWPDGTGELADITCGDPWYEEPDGKNPGFSLVVVRTARGRDILQQAIQAGYLKLERAPAWKLAKSQRNLMEKKSLIWGRQLAMRLFGLPTTDYRGARLGECWRRLPIKEKLKSVLGTCRRIITRTLYRRLKLNLSTAIQLK